MSVITTVEATPNRIAIVFRFFSTHAAPLDQKTLVSLLSPVPLRRKSAEGDSGATRMATSVVNECKALGLVEVTSDGTHLQVPMGLSGDVRSLLEERLTNPTSAKAHGQENVPYALAWFLCQSPDSPLAFSDNQKQVIEAETGGRALDLTNSSRFQQFSYWVQYLGLGWQLHGAGGTRLVPDPTEALVSHLRAILAGGEGHIRDVMAELGERLPVLETGAARTEVEQWLPAEKRRRPEDLSPATSLALLRLERRGVIRVEVRSDAPMMRMLTWPNTRQVSHLVWQGTVIGR